MIHSNWNKTRTRGKFFNNVKLPTFLGNLRKQNVGNKRNTFIRHKGCNLLPATRANFFFSKSTELLCAHVAKAEEAVPSMFVSIRNPAQRTGKPVLFTVRLTQPAKYFIARALLEQIVGTRARPYLQDCRW